MADCWSCGAERGASFVCPTCGTLQAPNKKVTFFEVLGLPRAMRLDAPVVERAFRELSKRVHPDKVGHASAVERRIALELTTLVNDAYRTLKDREKRAEYLMSLEGHDVAREDTRTQDPGLLMEMLELQEKVEEEKSPAALEALRKALMARRADRIESLARYFDDATGTRDGAIAQLIELRYLRRLVDRIDASLEESS